MSEEEKLAHVLMETSRVKRVNVFTAWTLNKFGEGADLRTSVDCPFCDYREFFAKDPYELRGRSVTCDLCKRSYGLLYEEERESVLAVFSEVAREYLFHGGNKK